MTPLDKCLYTLSPLIRQGDVNGIPLAEKAIDEFILAHEGPHGQTGALNILDRELIGLTQNLTGASGDLATTLLAYIDRRTNMLREKI